MSARYNYEVPSIQIEDAKTIEGSKTVSPFSKNIGPRGTLRDDRADDNTEWGHKVVSKTVHGRSIDEVATSAKVVWGGEFPCDLFGARDLKGARHEKPIITSDQYGHMRVRGLYDEYEVDYLMRASEYLRSKGIPTENVTHVYELNQIVLEGKLVDMDEYKKWALAEYTYRRSKPDAYPDEPQIPIKKVEDFISKTRFYEVERELQVSERIRDLVLALNKEEFDEVLGNVFKWLNVVTKTTDRSILPDTAQPPIFNIDNPESVQTFLTDWLPTQMGTYLSRCRKAGVRNDFGHAQQWSLVGTQYDSQSFVGEAINGEVLTDKDYVYSLREALGVLEELFNPDRETYIQNHFKDGLETAKRNLLKSYFEDLGDIVEFSDPAYSYSNLSSNVFYDGTQFHERTLSSDTYLYVAEHFGIDYSPKEKISFKLLEKIYSSQTNSKMASKIEKAPKYADFRENLLDFYALIENNFDQYTQETINNAMRLMIFLHFSQKDRPDGQPYINHLVKIANNYMRKVTSLNYEELIASLLHDSVEDASSLLASLEITPPDADKSVKQHALDTLGLVFGEDVADMVNALSHDDGGNYVDEISRLTENPGALRIKMLDFADNALRLDEIDKEDRKQKLYTKYAPVAQIFLDLLKASDCGFKDEFRLELMQRIRQVYRLN